MTDHASVFRNGFEACIGLREFESIAPNGYRLGHFDEALPRRLRCRQVGFREFGIDRIEVTKKSQCSFLAYPVYTHTH